MSDELNPELYILNENNKLITKEYIEDMLKKYGVEIKITNLELFQKAMIHKSYIIHDDEYYKKNKTKNTNKELEPINDPNKAVPLQTQSYERLEFLGDSVIHLILAGYLYKRYEEENEGFMTRLRTKLENGDTFYEFTKIIGLNKYILLSKYIDINNGRENNVNILEDTFEAFIGALFLEFGFEPCKIFVIKLIEDVVDFAQLLSNETNYKDTLLQYYHQMGWDDPTYGALDISGPDHKKVFTIFVKQKKNKRDDGEIVGIGVSSSKKRGEQEAAKQALIHYGLIQEENKEEVKEEELDFEMEAELN